MFWYKQYSCQIKIIQNNQIKFIILIRTPTEYILLSIIIGYVIKFDMWTKKLFIAYINNEFFYTL